MKHFFLLSLFILAILPSIGADQEGLMLGIDYHMTKLQNPYVSYSGSITSPAGLQEFQDSANYLFFPFGWKSFSEVAQVEVSTYGVNYILGLVGGLLSGKSSSDQDIRGENPTILDGHLENDPEKYFIDQDLLRFAASITVIDGLPIFLGVQGGLGNRGIDPPGSGSTGEGPGLVGFDDDAVVYGGANAGLGIQVAGLLIHGIAYYDWYYLLSKESTDGNTLTVDVNVLPFYSQESVLGGLYIKGSYRYGSFGYYKQFSELLPVDYSYSTFTLGVGLVL